MSPRNGPSLLLWLLSLSSLSWTTTTTSVVVVSALAFEAKQIKNAGGGLPTVPAGDRRLFDPAMEGMLGGTDDLNSRLAKGTLYSSPLSSSSSSSPSPLPIVGTVQDAQHWLEEYTTKSLPPVVAKANKPVTATVLGRLPLLHPSDNIGDIQHVLMKLPEGFHYMEGQSLSVIPPGIDAKTSKPYKPRLYSIASTRYGDAYDGTTISLCVRRAEYKDPNTGIVDPSKAGVCSGFLCSVQPADTVQVAGPVGKTMLLPPSLEPPSAANPNPSMDTDLILVATGTGIAPFRGFLHRLFVEDTLVKHLYTGTTWLIFGVPTTNGILYHDEFTAMSNNSNTLASTLELDIVKSREQTTATGEKKYVQHVLAEQSQKVFDRLEQGAHIYFCGLKGMMPGILQALEQVAISQGMDWSAKLKEYQQKGQWHVEVY